MAKITRANGLWQIPDDPEIGFIIGDGIGIDVVPVALNVIDAAVQKAYAGKRIIHWTEILAGEKALKQKGSLVPEESLEQVKQLKIVLKGPLETPVGGGHRSLNVALRQIFDLYSCIRPVRYFQGVPAPVKEPHLVDFVIFRENTEDVYVGIEWEAGSPEAKELIAFVKSKGKKIREDSGIGIKPISKFGTERLVRAAITYAIKNNRKSLTVVHKGNIMKYTEGAFKQWAFEMLKREFADKIVFENELKGPVPEEKIVVKDRIADSMLQQIILRPAEYDVIACPNLNGDYISDAAAAQVGGLGIAPGANIGDETAVFEATHGTAPKHAGQNKVNPGSVILSGVMMLELMGWNEAAQLISKGMEETIKQKKFTYDFERLDKDATLVSCSGFGEEIIKNMP